MKIKNIYQNLAFGLVALAISPLAHTQWSAMERSMDENGNVNTPLCLKMHASEFKSTSVRINESGTYVSYSSDNLVITPESFSIGSGTYDVESPKETKQSMVWNNKWHAQEFSFTNSKQIFYREYVKVYEGVRKEVIDCTRSESSRKACIDLAFKLSHEQIIAKSDNYFSDFLKNGIRATIKRPIGSPSGSGEFVFQKTSQVRNFIPDVVWNLLFFRSYEKARIEKRIIDEHDLSNYLNVGYSHSRIDSAVSCVRHSLDDVIAGLVSNLRK